jgi:hypothetical protein
MDTRKKTKKTNSDHSLLPMLPLPVVQPHGAKAIREMSQSAGGGRNGDVLGDLGPEFTDSGEPNEEDSVQTLKA